MSQGQALLRSLRAAGLLTGVPTQELERLVSGLEESLQVGPQDPALVMCLLDDLYGFDQPDQPLATARCCRDRVLVFNEIHETPAAPALARLRAFAEAHSLELPSLKRYSLSSAHAEDPPYVQVETLLEELDEALRGRPEKPFLAQWDCNVAVLIRSHLQDSMLPLEPWR